MPRFRKKPVEVDAIRYDGPACIVVSGSSTPWLAPEFDEVRSFIGSAFTIAHVGSVTHGGGEQHAPAVRTLEGVMRISPGDWVIRGTRGEVYPCKPEPFADTFEPVPDLVTGPGVVTNNA